MMIVNTLSQAYKKYKGTRLDPYGRRAKILTVMRGRALTVREIQILQYCADGMQSQGIASRLGLSKSMIDNYRADILAKMGRPTITACVAEAIRQNIIK